MRLTPYLYERTLMQRKKSFVIINEILPFSFLNWRESEREFIEREGERN